MPELALAYVTTVSVRLLPKLRPWKHTVSAPSFVRRVT
jgi:hypothetical protein